MTPENSGAWPWVGLTVVGVVLLAFLVLAIREAVAAVAERLWPRCCICGRAAGNYHNAIVDRWREVPQLLVANVRDGEQAFPGRRLTPPWVCGDCWHDGWRPESIQKPRELPP